MVTSVYDDITITEFEVLVFNTVSTLTKASSDRWRCLSHVFIWWCWSFDLGWQRLCRLVSGLFVFRI